ncbi:YdjY domain-containing protein [Loigolactobacillus backii]|uniref:YdjY domain-containing protein n=1 Tax=Loigolactobacillus backii TaxID=375175 RepID=UPI0022FDAC11|nr:YdjY domain-containing protein [Loigolactobacillus backii]MDA5386826.1 YdjY domain-containing protein [Loigolactobacillus backii]MDA5389389.1 YdjY domain-containing protein [Loigolactobacillus backii]
MKKKQIFISVMTALLLVLGIGFSLSSNSQAATKSVAGLTTSKPIKYDKQKKEITILTTVNGTYLTQPTRHVIVNVDGSNGNKSLLKTEATPKAFYQDLKKVGAKAGNNLTTKSKAGSKIKGSSLAVYFLINGKRVKAEKAVQVNGKNVKNLDFKFGGNMATNNKMKTGCVLCFDSCPVGIASGAKYGFQYGEHFTGKSSVLPKDGSQLAVVIKVK